MNRRRFLAMLSSGAFGAMTLDVDKLLWVPGQKTIFLPPARPYYVMDERVFFLSPDGIYNYMSSAFESIARAIDYDAMMIYKESVSGLG